MQTDTLLIKSILAKRLCSYKMITIKNRSCNNIIHNIGRVTEHLDFVSVRSNRKTDSYGVTLSDDKPS